MTGLYLHIPFCASRCTYCAFYSTVRLSQRDRYVDALCREMELRRSMPEGQTTIDTVYLGGGTPSQLSLSGLRKIFGRIRELWGGSPEEITVECNPDDVTPALASTLADEGVNRISMGAQTFSDERLRFLRRRHSAAEVEQAVRLLRDAGFGNISIDLMFGFPDETLAAWQADIRRAVSLGVEHISAYSLMYEEGTVLYRMREEGKIRETDEELSLSMYATLIDELTEVGFEHYEISNFARPGYRSQHNASYWQQVPYIGIGAAAHSYDLHSRSWNVSDIDRYMVAIERDEFPATHEFLDDDTRYDDLITTALRTREGIRLDDLEPPYREYLLSQADKQIERGTLAIDDGRIHLTRSGLFVSDLVMSELMKV